MNVRNVLPRDAIPSIDDPTFGAKYIGEPRDEVAVVEGDPARAYPFRILGYHEIVNDVVDGRALAVTWCPICWSAAVYERTVGDRTLTFGTSGKLADDALVMYDRETESEWKQTIGQAFAGDLAGTELEVVPAPIMTWERFVETYPNGLVLQPDRGPGGTRSREIYDLEPYERYLAAEEFGLSAMRGVGETRDWERTDLEAKTLVLGVTHGDAAVGYPIERVDRAGGVVTDHVGDLDVVVTLADHTLEAYEDPGYDYEFDDGVLRADGTTWDPHTGQGADGRSLDRVPARRMLAFAWQDAHGPDAFFES